MTPSRHPSSAVLLDHAADTLFVAHRVVIETHLLGCQVCKETVALLGRIGTVLAAAVSPIEPPHDVLERCLSSIGRQRTTGSNERADPARVAPRFLGGTMLPPPLDGLRPGRLRWIAPGIRHSTLWRDERSTLHFIRAEAGVTLPSHQHRGLELTCVLAGAFRDNGGVYTVGDLAEEDDNDEDNPRRDQDHVVTAEPEASCTCIMATTGRLRFSGWMARLLQPVMPF